MKIEMNYKSKTYCEISDWSLLREDNERNNIDIRITSHAGLAIEKAELIAALINIDFRHIPDEILLEIRRKSRIEWEDRCAAKHLTMEAKNKLA